MRLYMSLFAGVIVLAGCNLSQTPEAVAERYQECLKRADAECIWNLSDPTEFEDNNLTKAQLEKFLKEWVAPKFEGKIVEKRGPGLPNGTIQDFTYTIQTAKGERQLSVTLKKLDSGEYRVYAPLTILVVNDSIYDKSGKLMRKRNRALAQPDEFARISRELAPYGIRHIRVGDGSRAYTFDEAIARSITARERMIRAEKEVLGIE